MNRMWIRGIRAGAAVVLAVWAGGSAEAAVVDRTLATVGDEVILQSDVMGEIAPDLNALRATVGEEEFRRQAQELLRRALDQAVEAKLLVREAKLAGLTVEEQDIEKQLDDIRRRYRSTDEFLKDLESYGTTQTELRENLRERVMATRMARRKLDEFARQVVVTESDVAQYYADHSDDFVRPERVRLRQIYLPVESGQDPAVVRARLEQLKEEIESGADFGELATAHSQGPAAEQGGVVGWVVRGDLVEPLEQAAFSLAPGGVSDIIFTPDPAPGGMHLLLVEERQEAGRASLDEVRTEIEPMLRQQAAQERYQKWMNELRRKSRVQVYL